jgi:ecotin
MKTVWLAWLASALLFLLAILDGQAADNMKAFPPPKEGMVWNALQLTKQDNESAFKVELIVGRVEKETIKGWGFTRYKVSKLGPMAGTLMAIDPNAPKAARFVTLGSDPYIIRYSSRLPIVVYVPEGVEARYRIWSAGAEVKALELG